jgi:hypothetical protein
MDLRGCHCLGAYMLSSWAIHHQQKMNQFSDIAFERLEKLFQNLSEKNGRIQLNHFYPVDKDMASAIMYFANNLYFEQINIRIHFTEDYHKCRFENINKELFPTCLPPNMSEK